MYETRYGWTRRTSRKAVTNAMTAAVAVLALAVGAAKGGTLGAVIVVLGVLALLLGAGSAALSFATVRRRQVALRVDTDGILLGGYPLGYARTTALVPWSDIVGVELWVQRAGSMAFVGLHRTEGAPPLPAASSNPALARANERASGMCLDLLSASRPVHLWQLDTQRLLTTIARHAPHVVITVDPAFPGQG
ncbi:hypothetical protein GCM10010193_34380 [Kitasatospora atroaurantiaca]